MVDELTYETLLGSVDALLELQPQEVNSAEKPWSKLEELLDELVEATKFDDTHHRHLAELVAVIEAAAAELHQSLVNLGGRALFTGIGRILPSGI